VAGNLTPAMVANAEVQTTVANGHGGQKK